MVGSTVCPCFHLRNSHNQPKSTQRELHLSYEAAAADEETHSASQRLALKYLYGPFDTGMYIMFISEAGRSGGCGREERRE